MRTKASHLWANSIFPKLLNRVSRGKAKLNFAIHTSELSGQLGGAIATVARLRCLP